MIVITIVYHCAIIVYRKHQQTYFVGQARTAVNVYTFRRENQKSHMRQMDKIITLDGLSYFKSKNEKLSKDVGA